MRRKIENSKEKPGDGIINHAYCQAFHQEEIYAACDKLCLPKLQQRTEDIALGLPGRQLRRKWKLVELLKRGRS